MQAYIRGVEQKFDFESKRSLTFVLFDLPSGRTLRAQVEDIEELSELIDVGLESEPDPNPEYYVPDAPSPQHRELQAGLQASYENTEAGNDDSFIQSHPDADKDPRAAEAVPVEWAKLDDELLPPHLKKALSYLEVPEVVMSDYLDELVHSIESEFGEGDWNAILPKEEETTQVVHVASSPQTSAPVESPNLGGLRPAAEELAQAVVELTKTTPAPAKPAPEPQVETGKVTWSDGSPILPTQMKRAKTVPKDEFGYPIVSSQAPQAPPTTAINADTDAYGVAQI